MTSYDEPPKMPQFAAPPRQTLSFLREKFEAAGIRPRTDIGQNFLIDLNLLHILLEAAELSSNDVVLEVGTGTGSLSALLAGRAASVITVEIDPRLHLLAAEHLHHLPNVTMLQTDVLQSKNRLNPLVLEAVDAQLNAAPGRCWKLVANLPYHIATPLISNLLTLEYPPQSMTVTLQRELAERIVAPPGCKDYGSLSVWVQAQCRVKILRVLPPEAFWPRPKVASAFLRITLDPERRKRLADREYFHEFIRVIFLHRRKMLRAVLLSAVKNRFSKPEIDALMERLHLNPSSRAEQLDIETLIALCEAVRQHP